MINSFTLCNDVTTSLFVKSFWQTQGSPEYKMEYILPKGDIELIFSFGESLSFHRQGVGEGDTPRCFINGISNTPVQLAMPRHQSFFGVVVQPAAVKKLLAAPSGTFLNSITDLELIDKTFGDLWHMLASSTAFEHRCSLMQQWILRRLSTIHEQEMTLSGFLTSNQEVTTVANLASHVCYSTRQLNRKVQELFGMSSEVLLRYKRYQRALKHIHISKETLTRIAYDCGYYDQAHFNREFKEYTRLTPGEYRQQRSHLPGHIFQ
jgi:AraC-like DNA-binding protein